MSATKRAFTDSAFERTSHGSYTPYAPSNAGGLDPDLQQTLQNVGMRVRKSVNEGYKQSPSNSFYPRPSLSTHQPNSFPPTAADGASYGVNGAASLASPSSSFTSSSTLSSSSSASSNIFLSDADARRLAMSSLHSSRGGGPMDTVDFVNRRRRRSLSPIPASSSTLNLPLHPASIPRSINPSSSSASSDADADANARPAERQIRGLRPSNFSTATSYSHSQPTGLRQTQSMPVHGSGGFDIDEWEAGEPGGEFDFSHWARREDGF